MSPIVTIIALWLSFNALLFVWLGFVRFAKWYPVPKLRCDRRPA